MSFGALLLAVTLNQADGGNVELDAGAPATVAATSDAGQAAPNDITPVDFVSDVKLVYDVVTCQSVTLPATLPAAPVEAYCKVQKPRFERFMSHWGTKGRAFLANLRPAVLPPELVYPFGGGDLMMALTTFPEAQVITTMSLELAGDPRRLARVTDAKALQQSLQALAETSGTTLVSNDSKSVNMSKIQRGEVPGQLSMHLIGLAMHGFVPAAVRYFRIEPDGALHYLTAADFDAVDGQKTTSLHSKWKAPDFSAAFANVEVEFVPVGQPDAPRRLHRHIAADLSDDGLTKNPGLLKHLEAKGHVAGMTKAASYLLWNDGFSKIRSYLMQHVDFMFSDSTGLLPRFVKQAGLTLETYGSFQKSFLGTWEGNQAELRNVYAAQPTRALPMRFGYPDGSPEKRSHLQVVRRPAGDAGQ